MSDPFTGSHFQVEWGGTTIGFHEVSGLEIRSDVIEYSEGNAKENTPRKIPGRVHYGNIRFSRGVVRSNNEFFEWWNTLRLHRVERRDLTIVLLDEEHNPVVVWKVRNAFPVSIRWDRLEASANDVFLEHLEVANEGIVVENG